MLLGNRQCVLYTEWLSFGHQWLSFGHQWQVACNESPHVRPLLTSTSKVRGISRMDLIPADTTATGVRPSSIRSALMSIAAVKKAVKEGLNWNSLGSSFTKPHYTTQYCFIQDSHVRERGYSGGPNINIIRDKVTRVGLQRCQDFDFDYMMFRHFSLSSKCTINTGYKVNNIIASTNEAFGGGDKL